MPWAFRVSKPLSMGSFLMERIFQLTPNGVLTVAARCVTEAFSTICAVHIEDCEGWWLSGCCSSVAEHTSQVCWVRLLVTAGLFTLFSPCNIQIHLLPKLGVVLLRASCLTLKMNKFRCYEAKIEELPGVEPRTLLFLPDNI